MWAEFKTLPRFVRSIGQLTEEIPSASRALLAEKPVESLDFDIDPAIQTAWTTEARSG